MCQAVRAPGANVTLSSGIYYINGDLTWNSNGTLDGTSGVMFYVTGHVWVTSGTIKVNPMTSGVASGIGNSTSSTGVSKSRSIHSALPHIGFLPDGSLSENSPQKLRLTGRDGISIWVALSRNRLNYEIQSRGN